MGGLNMGNNVLKLEERQAIGGSRVKRLRKSGYVPAVIYGKSINSVAVQVKKSKLREFLTKNGKNAVFTAEFENGESYPALVKEVEYDVIKNEFLHVDFQQVSLTEKIKATIPIRIIGREAVKRVQGVLAQQLDEVEVECFPQERAGYKEIRVKVKPHTDADEQVLKDWLAAVENRCPVSDNIRNVTPVKISL
jgi:large subunit ribosomal protein L25